MPISSKSSNDVLSRATALLGRSSRRPAPRKAREYSHDADDLMTSDDDENEEEEDDQSLNSSGAVLERAAAARQTKMSAASSKLFERAKQAMERREKYAQDDSDISGMSEFFEDDDKSDVATGPVAIPRVHVEDSDSSMEVDFGSQMDDNTAAANRDHLDIAAAAQGTLNLSGSSSSMEIEFSDEDIPPARQALQPAPASVHILLSESDSEMELDLDEALAKSDSTDVVFDVDDSLVADRSPSPAEPASQTMVASEVEDYEDDFYEDDFVDDSAVEEVTLEEDTLEKSGIVAERQANQHSTVEKENIVADEKELQRPDVSVGSPRRVSIEEGSMRMHTLQRVSSQPTIPPSFENLVTQAEHDEDSYSVYSDDFEDNSSVVSAAANEARPTSHQHIHHQQIRRRRSRILFDSRTSTSLNMVDEGTSYSDDFEHVHEQVPPAPKPAPHTRDVAVQAGSCEVGIQVEPRFFTFMPFEYMYTSSREALLRRTRERREMLDSSHEAVDSAATESVPELNTDTRYSRPERPSSPISALRNILQSIERSQKMLQDETNTLSYYRYSTFTEAKQSLRKRKDKALSLDDALRIVDLQDSRAFR